MSKSEKNHEHIQNALNFALGAAGLGGIGFGANKLRTADQQGSGSRALLTYGYVPGKGSGHLVMAERLKALINKTDPSLTVDLVNSNTPSDMQKIKAFNPEDYVLHHDTGYGIFDGQYGAPLTNLVGPLKRDYHHTDPEDAFVPFDTITNKPYAPDKLHKILEHEHGVKVPVTKPIVTISSGGSGVDLHTKVASVMEALKDHPVHYVIAAGEAATPNMQGREKEFAFLNKIKDLPNVTVLGHLPSDKLQDILSSSNINVGYGGSSSITEQLGFRNPNINLRTGSKPEGTAYNNMEWAAKHYGIPHVSVQTPDVLKKHLTDMLTTPETSLWFRGQHADRFVKNATSYHNKFKEAFQQIANVRKGQVAGAKAKAAYALLAGVGLLGFAGHRSMKKEASDDSGNNDPLITKPEAASALASAGVMAGHSLSSGVQNALKPEKPEDFNKALDALLSLDSKKKEIGSQEFAHLYAQLGHELTRQRVSSGDIEGLNPGIAIRENVTKTLKTNLQSNPLFHFLVPHAGLREKLSDFPLEKLKHGSLEHYKNFEQSPLSGYKMMIAEIFGNPYSQEYTAQASNGLIGHNVDLWADALAHAPRDRAGFNRYMTTKMNLPTIDLITKRLNQTVDTFPFFKELLAHLNTANGTNHRVLGDVLAHAEGVPLATWKQHIMNLPWLRGAETEGIANTQVPLFRILDKHIKDKGIHNLEELRTTPHILQQWFEPIMGTHFKGATYMYAKAGKLYKLLTSMAGKKPVYAAAALAGIPAYTAINRFRQQHSKEAADSSTKDTKESIDTPTLLSGAASAGLASSLYDKLKTSTLRRQYNPLAPIHVSVIGGQRDIPLVNELNTVTPQAIDSFSGQTRAIYEALKKDKGIHPTTHTAWHKEDSKYIPRDLAHVLHDTADSDAVVQVGSLPEEHLILNLNKPKYRALSDFGPGNLNQPNIWFEQNWMRLKGNPKAYDRLIVPGGEHYDMGGLKGKKANINTPNIPVSDIFSKVMFNVDHTKNPKLLISSGGGSMLPQMFIDIANKDGYDLTKSNILDKLHSALTKKHGNNFDMNYLLGQSLNDIKTDNPKMYDFLMALQNDKARFGGKLKFIEKLSQQALANEYATSHYIAHLPGSTTGELLSMPGEKHGKILNVVPDRTLPWMPDHFVTNAPMIEKHFPGSMTVHNMANGKGVDPSLLDSFVNSTNPSGRGKAIQSDMSNFINTLKSDIRTQRVSNLKNILPQVLLTLITAGYSAKNLAHFHDAKHKSLKGNNP